MNYFVLLEYGVCFDSSEEKLSTATYKDIYSKGIWLFNFAILL